MPESAIYEGSVRHRRNLPRHHEFDFKFFMLLLDIDEIPGVLNRTFWSTRRWRLCRFKQQDHLRRYLSTANPNDSTLRERVVAALGDLGVHRPVGPIRLLTQLSYFGFSMNPVSFFYCYSPDGSTIEAIIAEVNNTPWGQQHLYLVDAVNSTPESVIRSGNIKKDFHVSPFLSLDMDYRMVLTPPGQRLAVKIENHLLPTAAENCDGGDACQLPDDPANQQASLPSRKNKIIDVTMSLHRRPMTSRNLNWLLVKYPAISMQVFVGIYWQALILYLKKIPFVPHPDKAGNGQFATTVQHDS
jgi:DUF1365 family protein